MKDVVNGSTEQPIVDMNSRILLTKVMLVNAKPKDFFLFVIYSQKVMELLLSHAKNTMITIYQLLENKDPSFSHSFLLPRIFRVWTRLVYSNPSNVKLSVNSTIYTYIRSCHICQTLSHNQMDDISTFEKK